MNKFEIGTPTSHQAPDYIALEKMANSVQNSTNQKPQQDNKAFAQMNQDEKSSFQEYQRRLELSRQSSNDNSSQKTVLANTAELMIPLQQAPEQVHTSATNLSHINTNSHSSLAQALKEKINQLSGSRMHENTHSRQDTEHNYQLNENNMLQHQPLMQQLSSQYSHRSRYDQEFDNQNINHLNQASTSAGNQDYMSQYLKMKAQTDRITNIQSQRKNTSAVQIGANNGQLQKMIDERNPQVGLLVEQRHNSDVFTYPTQSSMMGDISRGVTTQGEQNSVPSGLGNAPVGAIGAGTGSLHTSVALRQQTNAVSQAPPGGNNEDTELQNRMNQIQSQLQHRQLQAQIIQSEDEGTTINHSSISRSPDKMENQYSQIDLNNIDRQISSARLQSGYLNEQSTNEYNTGHFANNVSNINKDSNSEFEKLQLNYQYEGINKTRQIDSNPNINQFKKPPPVQQPQTNQFENTENQINNVLGMYSEELKEEAVKPSFRSEYTNQSKANEALRTDFYQRKTEDVENGSERSKVDVNSLHNNIFMKQVHLQGNNVDLTSDSKYQEMQDQPERPRYEYKSSFAKRYFDEQSKNDTGEQRNLLQGLDYLKNNAENDCLINLKKIDNQSVEDSSSLDEGYQPLRKQQPPQNPQKTHDYGHNQNDNVRSQFQQLKQQIEDSRSQNPLKFQVRGEIVAQSEDKSQESDPIRIEDPASQLQAMPIQHHEMNYNKNIKIEACLGSQVENIQSETTPYFQTVNQLSQRPENEVDTRKYQLMPKVTELEQQFYQNKVIQEEKQMMMATPTPHINAHVTQDSYSPEYSPINPSYKQKASDLLNKYRQDMQVLHCQRYDQTTSSPESSVPNRDSLEGTKDNQINFVQSIVRQPVRQPSPIKVGDYIMQQKQMETYQDDNKPAHKDKMPSFRSEYTNESKANALKVLEPVVFDLSVDRSSLGDQTDDLRYHHQEGINITLGAPSQSQNETVVQHYSEMPTQQQSVLGDKYVNIPYDNFMKGKSNDLNQNSDYEDTFENKNIGNQKVQGAATSVYISRINTNVNCSEIDVRQSQNKNILSEMDNMENQNLYFNQQQRVGELGPSTRKATLSNEELPTFSPNRSQQTIQLVNGQRMSNPLCPWGDSTHGLENTHSSQTLVGGIPQNNRQSQMQETNIHDNAREVTTSIISGAGQTRSPSIGAITSARYIEDLVKQEQQMQNKIDSIRKRISPRPSNTGDVIPADYQPPMMTNVGLPKEIGLNKQFSYNSQKPPLVNHKTQPDMISDDNYLLNHTAGYKEDYMSLISKEQERLDHLKQKFGAGEISDNLSLLSREYDQRMLGKDYQVQSVVPKVAQIQVHKKPSMYEEIKEQQEQCDMIPTSQRNYKFKDMKQDLEDKFYNNQNNEIKVKRLIKAVSVHLKDNKDTHLPEAQKKIVSKQKKSKKNMVPIPKDSAAYKEIAQKKAYKACKQNYCIHKPELPKQHRSLQKVNSSMTDSTSQYSTIKGFSNLHSQQTSNNCSRTELKKNKVPIPGSGSTRNNTSQHFKKGLTTVVSDNEQENTVETRKNSTRQKKQTVKACKSLQCESESINVKAIKSKKAPHQQEPKLTRNYSVYQNQQQLEKPEKIVAKLPSRPISGNKMKSIQEKFSNEGRRRSNSNHRLVAHDIIKKAEYDSQSRLSSKSRESQNLSFGKSFQTQMNQPIVRKSHDFIKCPIGRKSVGSKSNMSEKVTKMGGVVSHIHKQLSQKGSQISDGSKRSKQGLNGLKSRESNRSQLRDERFEQLSQMSHHSNASLNRKQRALMNVLSKDLKVVNSPALSVDNYSHINKLNHYQPRHLNFKSGIFQSNEKLTSNPRSQNSRHNDSLQMSNNNDYKQFNRQSTCSNSISKPKGSQSLVQYSNVSNKGHNQRAVNKSGSKYESQDIPPIAPKQQNFVEKNKKLLVQKLQEQKDKKDLQLKAQDSIKIKTKDYLDKMVQDHPEGQKKKFEKNILDKMNSLMEFLVAPQDDENEYVITITKKPKNN